MITLLGVGHVFGLGPRIRQEILARRPDAVCLELDEFRLRALEAPVPRRIPPGLYGILAAFQRRIAEAYGGDVGEEMLAAREAGRELGVPVILMDRDSRETWGQLQAAMGPRELVRILLSALASLFVGKERVEAELDRYRRDTPGFLEELARDYPAVRAVLVDARNDHMAEALRRIQAEAGRVVAVVGDGHVEGLRERLADLEVEAVRLWDLRAGA